MSLILKHGFKTATNNTVVVAGIEAVYTRTAADSRSSIAALVGNSGCKTDTTTTVVAGITANAKPTVANHRITSATDCLPTRLNLPLRNLGHILG